MQLVRTAVAASLVFAVGNVAAQPAATSSDTSTVTIVKENAVLLSDVDDIDFGTPGALDATTSEKSDDVCVFSSTGAYTVTASSAGGFQLTDSTVAGTTIDYTVTWNAATAPATVGGAAGAAADSTLGGVGVTVTAPQTEYAGDRDSLDCSSGTNASFTVDLEEADYNAAPAGTYTDTLTLEVTPV